MAISDQAGVPKSALSDLLGPDRRSLPRQELLADVLGACGLGLQDIVEWETRRRLAARNSRSEAVDSGSEIERLQSALAAAVHRVDEFRADESRLRDRLHAAEQEKQELTQALEATRARSDRSTAELSARLIAAEQKSDRLTNLAEEAANRALQAEVDAAHLRARLTMIELELLHERVRRNERRLPVDSRMTPARQTVAATTENTMVGARDGRPARQFLLVNDQLATVSEDVRRAAELLAGARACLERSQETTAALVFSDSRYEDLAPVTSFVLTCLRECGAAGEEIEATVREYVARL